MPEQGKRSRLGLLGRLPLIRRQPRPFEAELARQAVERHRRILEPDPFPDYPYYFTAAAVLDDANDGFMPLPRAAREMGCSTDELVAMVLQGLIEIDRRGWARPAIVSVLRVRR